jgi:uncharacterized protein YjeT (DUF2065 family)
MKLLFSLIGIVLVLEGLPYAAFPHAMQRWLRQMAVMPPKVVRVFGFLAMAAGLLLCYITQRTTLFG